MVDRGHLILVLGYLGALAWPAYEWLREPSSSAVPIEATDEPFEIPTILPSQLGSVDAFGEIVERPLFAETRSPAPGPEPTPLSQAAPQIANNLNNVRLTAVVMDGARATALVENASGTVEKIRDGGRIQNWQVDRIEDDRIILVANGRRQELSVYNFDPVTSVRSRQRVSASPRGRARLVTEPTDASGEESVIEDDGGSETGRGTTQ